MGAKTWMLVQADKSAKSVLAEKPLLNRDSSLRLVRSLFPEDGLTETDDGDLLFTSPPDDEIYVGDFGCVKIIAAKEFGIDYPSKLPARFIAEKGETTLHAMHSAVDWFAFAHWVDGKLMRSLSLSPDSGVMEDIGGRMEFEKPYWDGVHPAVDDEEEEDYPFVFHPLELGEAALANFFGYQLEGMSESEMIEAEDVPLMSFKRSRIRRATKPWWCFWK